MRSEISKILFISISFLIIMVISTCCNCHVDKFIVAFSDVNLANIDNSGATAFVSNTNIIPERAYQLQIKLITQQKMAQNCVLFSNSTYAFRCPDGEFSYNNYPKNIEIYSTHNFDSLHPSGTLLNDFFVNTDFASDIANKIENRYYEDNNYFENPTSYHISLIKAPISDSIQQFYVKIFCSEGLVLSDTAAPVKLIKL